MGGQTVSEKKLVLEIDRATAYAGNPIRACISVLDEEGRGSGHRLFGPKYAGIPGKMLKTYELDERDRQAIRSALDEVEDRPKPCRSAGEWGECVLADGHETREPEHVGEAPCSTHVDRWGRHWGVKAG